MKIFFTATLQGCYLAFKGDMESGGGLGLDPDSCPLIVHISLSNAGLDRETERNLFNKFFRRKRLKEEDERIRRAIESRLNNVHIFLANSVKRIPPRVEGPFNEENLPGEKYYKDFYLLAKEDYYPGFYDLDESLIYYMTVFGIKTETAWTFYYQRVVYNHDEKIPGMPFLESGTLDMVDRKIDYGCKLVKLRPFNDTLEAQWENYQKRRAPRED